MTMTTHDSDEALATAGHHHTVQVAIGPPHMQTEYLCWLVVCQDVASWASCYWSIFCLLPVYALTTTIQPLYHIAITIVQVAQVEAENLCQLVEENSTCTVWQS